MILVQGLKYVINKKHRTRLPKSDCTQWIVTEKDEITFFDNTVSAKFLCRGNFYWWVETCKATNNPLQIGRTDLHYAYIAKFRSDNNNEWHGYPVTGERNPHDVPPTSILESWFKNKVFSKKEVSDITRGRGYVRSCA